MMVWEGRGRKAPYPDKANGDTLWTSDNNAPGSAGVRGDLVAVAMYDGKVMAIPRRRRLQSEVAIVA